jgi:ribosomal protein S18 acetylase RimI-like enzyme
MTPGSFTRPSLRVVIFGWLKKGTTCWFPCNSGSYVDRLYVLPSFQRVGIGTTLIGHAEDLSPNGLELHPHQKNRVARDFYEKQGFKAVRFGVSPAPENEPDVEYHWRPDFASAPNRP